MRHAFLVIAHNNPEILYSQLEILDSVNTDFYFHLDVKMKFNKENLKEHVSKSNIFFINPKKIRWGHYSQIECEMRLLEAALYSRKTYDYYHLLSGVDMPIKSYSEIDEFFSINKDKEYVHFDELRVDQQIRERISLYHFCPGRTQWQRKINGFFIKIQKCLKIDRLKNTGWIVQKGANWFSITEELAKDLIKNKKIIQKKFHYSFCGDEVFLQTYIFNSKFRSKLYFSQFNNDYHACMRFIDWERGTPYVFGIEDLDELLKSDYMFARKFDYVNKPEIVDKLTQVLKMTGEIR